MAAERFLPGARFAARIVHPGSPTLRIRYRPGVFITPYGFPDWLLYSRAMVELPAPDPRLGLDEQRILDVLTANRAMVGSGDPLWPARPDDATPRAVPGPAGWAWAHQALSRRIALVPAALHGSFRHLGGVATMRSDRRRRGVELGDEHRPVRLAHERRLATETVDALERALAMPLPGTYREFLAATDGGRPAEPGVHVGFGFVADQPMFGLGVGDRHQQVQYANRWFADRLTADFLAIGYVQGGTLAIRVRGADLGSVWYLDDDDHRDDDDRYDASYICRTLLRRCADDLPALWAALSPPPSRLVTAAATAVRDGQATVVRPTDMAAGLPAGQRPPGVTASR